MKKTIVWIRAALVALIAFLLLPFSLQAASVTMAWGPSISSTLAGYVVSYGLLPGVYTLFYDAGPTPSATISGLTPGVQYYFSINAYGDDGESSAYSNEIALTASGDSAASDLAISSNPMSLGVLQGVNATFQVAATGGTPDSYTYQWYFNGTALPGATQSNLTVNSATVANAGTYYAVVTSGSAQVISSPAVLTVYVAPLILNSFSNMQARPGSAIRLRSVVTGSSPMTFQWFHDGVAISGKTNISMGLAAISSLNAGVYSLQVQNMAGSATAALYSVTVIDPMVAASGVYNGLFYQTNANAPNVTAATAGMLANCLVATNGLYSARVALGGINYPLAGTFDGFGNDTEVVSRASRGLPDVTFALHLDLSGTTRTITGTVSNMDTNMAWVSPLMADLATNALAIPSGSSLLSLTTVGGTLTSPHGLATLLTSASGTVTMAGMLFDGTQISQSSPLSQDGLIPVYCSLYGGNGILTGWISMANGSPVGTITWIRPTGVITPIPYPRGFTNVFHLN